MIPFSFLLSLMALIIQMHMHFPILAFVPFLAVVSLLAKFSNAILLAALAGFCLDLVSSDPFGIHALNYSLCVLALYRYRTLFSATIPLQFSIYTAVFSSVSTILQIGLLFLFDSEPKFLGRWWLVCLPCIDAVYALIWFAGPLALVRMGRRMWSIFWLKRNSQN